jgi:hypothetical protein
VKGSHATLAGWEPKTCSLCGRPVRVSRESAWYHWSHVSRTAFAVHVACSHNNPGRMAQLLEEADRP